MWVWASSECRPVSSRSRCRCQELVQIFGGSRGGVPGDWPGLQRVRVLSCSPCWGGVEKQKWWRLPESPQVYSCLSGRSLPLHVPPCRRAVLVSVSGSSQDGVGMSERCSIGCLKRELQIPAYNIAGVYPALWFLTLLLGWPQSGPLRHVLCTPRCPMS